MQDEEIKKIFDKEDFEIEPDTQKHLIRGRIEKINANALKKIVTLTIKVYEPYLDQNNEYRDNYEEFTIVFNYAYGQFANAEGVNTLNQLNTGYQVVIRYRQKSYFLKGLKKMNIGTYIKIEDKRFIPAHHRKLRDKAKQAELDEAKRGTRAVKKFPFDE
jgi:hypothetical protein